MTDAEIKALLDEYKGNLEENAVNNDGRLEKAFDQFENVVEPGVLRTRKQLLWFGFFLIVLSSAIQILVVATRK